MILDHWLLTAKKLESPHFNFRPAETDISLLVIHNISLPPTSFIGHFVEDFFTGNLDVTYHPYFEEIKELRVSSHLYIRRDGTIIQFVPFDKRAWHAGVSSFQGCENCNDYSIGIELEGTDTLAYTDAQYSALSASTRSICATYPLITSSRIVGHCDIAPTRKTDPGDSFDWPRYRALL